MLPWVSLVVSALAVACAGGGAWVVWAVASALDGSRAWWTADARALVAGILAGGGAVAAGGIWLAVGGAWLWWRGSAAPVGGAA